MVKQIKTRGLKFLKIIILGFFGLSILSAIIFKFVPIPITPLMIIRTSEQLFDKDKEVKLVKDWVSINKISKSMQLAVVCAEDQKYLNHLLPGPKK